MGSGSSVPAFQLTTEEAAGVDAFVAAGVAEVPSLARRVEELQAGAQESERLIEGVAQEQLQEEVRSLRRRVEELQEEVAQLKEEAGAEEAERLLDEAQTQLLEEAAVETALAQVAGRRVEELQAGSHDSEKLQEEVRSLRQAEAAAARRIEELERLREVCSLHQAETAATQRIQELDSYLREEAKGVEQVLGSAGGGTSSSAELATEAKRERNEVIVRIKARWESQKLKHILEIQEQQFGKEDRDTLNTKIDLAAALQLQNDFTGAQKQLEEVFEALGRAQSADLKPQLEEVSEALGRAGPTDLKDELHGCCETSACAHPTTRKDDPITRRAVDCFASLLGCLHEDKETMLKEVSKMQSQKLGEEHPLTVNSKADLAVVLQERDEQKEAAQVLKEILQEPHGHDVGIDFLKDLTLSPGPAAAAKDSAIDDKKKFTLHFVAKERAHANTEETSDIKYEGKIRSGASACWISFPGKFAAGWDALVAELHGDSVACVFLSTPDSGLGWHHKFADGSCYCKHIYGERDFETFGYLVKMKDRDSEKLKREQAKAKLTHAVVVAADATDKEEEKCRQEAERRWKENGKTAAWGCQWFHAWKEKVHEAVEKKQTLRVVFFPGQKGQGKLTFPELKYRNLWDSIGCGGSQKCEIAYVEHMRAQFGSAWEYEEIDVARFLQKEFPMHSIVDAKHGNRWRTGVLLKTVPSFDDDVVTRSAELKWIVKCKETQQIFVSRHIRHATEAIYNLMDNGGHDALKKALQSAIPKNIQAELPFRSRLPRGTPSIAFNVKAEEIETVQVLRDKVLSGELNLNMRQSLAQDPHASADIEVDQSEFLEAYERSLQRLSKLTDHQQEKLAELKEPNQDLHLTAPAGGGKTFVAAKYVLERLQRNPKGLVLYVCPCISLGLYFLRWLARWYAAETKESTRAATETLMERVVMLEKPYEKFILLNIQGDQIVQTPAAPVSQSVTTNQKLEFMLAVFDEGHEVLRHRNILDGISSQTTLLLSDTSQSSETSQRFPSIKRVALTQVVRSTKRIVRGAAAFQLSDEGQHTTSLGTDGPPLKCFIFKSDAEITPGGFKHEYVEFIMKAFWHVAQTFSSLRSFNNRIALLVPDDSFVKKLKVPLQEELDHSFRQRNLRLFSFNESLSFLPTEFPEAKDEVIILDTVDRSRGHEAFIVICIGLDEAIEGQGAEVDLATRAQLYVGISRAQFMAIVVNCHVPGGWLEFLTKLEFKESKFEETSGRAEIRTNAAAETLKVSAVPNSWQTTASESAHGADESKHDEDTKPKHGQVQDFPERTELKVLKSSVWDTMIDSEIASQIHHLRFDPRAEAKPPPEADAKEDAAQAEADAKEDAAQAKADEAEAAKCGNNIIMAARLGHLGGIRHLLRTVPGAVAKKSSGLNVTALHGAVYHGHAEICRVLLAAGAEVDAREIEGETPLHLAAYYGRAEVVKLLVEAKASVTVKDNKGNTPLDDARRKGHDEIVTMLERAA